MKRYGTAARALGLVERGLNALAELDPNTFRSQTGTVLKNIDLFYMSYTDVSRK